jgi:hypothetical protein
MDLVCSCEKRRRVFQRKVQIRDEEETKRKLHRNPRRSFSVCTFHIVSSRLLSKEGWNRRHVEVKQSKEYSFIHLVVCLTTGPKPLPKRTLHIVRSRASSFKWEYPLLSLRSYNSFLRLLPCLSVISIPPCIFPSITRCRRQFQRIMWPIQLAFRLRISYRIFLCSLTLSNTSSFLTWSVQLIFSILLHHILAVNIMWSEWRVLCQISSSHGGKYWHHVVRRDAVYSGTKILEKIAISTFGIFGMTIACGFQKPYAKIRTVLTWR